MYALGAFQNGRTIALQGFPLDDDNLNRTLEGVRQCSIRSGI
jgi:hypothetical protein